MIISGIESLRDPFVLAENGVYYAYGTGVSGEEWDNTIWACYKNTSGRLDGEWRMTEKLVYELPKAAEKNRWAPEVHKYNGKFYMFATYFSSETQHRGYTILRSDFPEGPFVEITNGHITPDDWDSIDGTLYVDPTGQPWMVFVHEWTSWEDKMGRMAVAKLSKDLTSFVSEPVDIFKADDPSWGKGNITDGCFMYTTKEGELLMIWSNYDDQGYCVGISRSDNGRLDGNWSHDEKLLYSKSMTGVDGGHGMIFKDFDGKMYLSIHSPNHPNEDYKAERTVFVPVKEENGTLVCEF